MSSMVHRVGATRKRLSRSSERLATGKRLNRAGDDPAGIAQAARPRARVRSLEQSKQNIRQGRTLLETVGTALADITNDIHRIRALAVRAASDTILHRDRLGLDFEVQGLLRDIDRTASETELATGLPLVPNEFEWAPPSIDVGVAVDVSGSMGSYFAPLISGLNVFVDRMASASVQTNVGVARIGKGEDPTDAAVRVSDIGEDPTAALAGLTTVGQSMETYSALTNLAGGIDRPGVTDPDAFTWTQADNRHVIVLTDTSAVEGASLAGDTEASTANALASQGVRAHVIGVSGRASNFDEIVGSAGSWHLLGANGSNIAAALQAIGDDILNVQDTPPEPKLTEVQAGAGQGERFDLELPVDATLSGLGLEGLNLVTKGAANTALDSTSAAMETVLGYQGGVGAKLNRLTHAENVQAAQHMAAEATRARLEDADFGVEAREYFGQQMKLQAATALFARMQQMEQATASAMTGTLGGARLVGSVG